MEEEILKEIPDSEVIWDVEVKEVYIEKGVEYPLDGLLNDFYLFCCYMFRRMGFREPTTIQRMIIEFLAKDSGDKYKMIQAPRGAGKSFISQLKVLWDILRNNDHHILIRSASDKRSRNYTTFLLNLIKTTPLLQHLAPQSGQRKSTELFDVYGAKPSDSPTVLSETVAGTVTGLRATIIVLDDVEVINNSSSPTTRALLESQVTENFNLLAETTDEDGNKVQGTVVVLGTFQSGDSIYVPMIRSGAYDTLIVPAEYPPITEWYSEFVHPDIMKVSKEEPHRIGTAIDERLNDEFLAKKRMISKSNYELHFMLNPFLSDQLKYPLKLKDLIVYDIDPVDNPIRFIYSSEEKIRIKHKGFNGDYLVAPAFTSPERIGFQYTVMSLDVSGKGEDETGYCVASLMGGKVFVRDIGGISGGYDDDSLQTLVGIAMKYNVNCIVVESNFGGGSITAMIEKKLFENNFKPRIEEKRAVGQKEIRIIDTLEPLLNQHRIIIDRQALEKDFEKKADYSFTYQFSHITRQRNSLRHDDIIDAMELAVGFMVEFMARGEEMSMNRYKEEKAKKAIEQFNKGLFPQYRKQPLTTSYISNY